MSLLYTKDEAEAAHKAWKSSCGHFSCAAASGKTLDDVKRSRVALKGWMNPTMITTCLDGMGMKFEKRLIPYDPTVHPFAHMVFEKAPVLPRIFRVQFEGPWMKGPVTGRYKHTHYIASLEKGVMDPIYEPSEILEHAEWLDLAPEWYAKCIKNCTGYHFTHAWTIIP